MKINGREIADSILETLKLRVEKLQTQGIFPQLAVVRVGNDPAVTSYINQKQQRSEKIGIQVTVHPYPDSVSEETLLETILSLNQDKRTHGIILQLPIPEHIDKEKLLLAIDPKKDVDGFHPLSTFPIPLAEAVLEIFRYIHFLKDPEGDVPLSVWLGIQNMVILGKGKTGGQPITSLLQNIHLHPTVIDSKTKNPDQIIKHADILICAVGKPHLITKAQIKKDAILIGIGMNKSADGKFYGDYDEDDIKDIAGFYTPIPGGVGPVNVAKLLENVVIAAEKSSS